MTHQQLIQECVIWFKNTHKEEAQVFYGVNNNSHDRRSGALARGQGVTAGVLDLCYVLPGVVAYLDAKVGNDDLSKEQKEFIRMVEERGGICFTFSSLREFQDIINQLQETYLV